MKYMLYSPPVEIKGIMSDYLSHVVEHCVGQQRHVSVNEYFHVLINQKVHVLPTYAVYDLPWLSKDQAYEYLTQPLEEAVIEKEILLFRQEMVDYENPVIAAIEKKLYWNVVTPNADKFFSIEQIKSYHATYYTPRSILLYNDKYEVELPIAGGLLNSESDADVWLQKWHTQVDDVAVHRYAVSNAHWQNYYMLFFVKELYDNYSRYYYRYHDRSLYDYPEIKFFMTPQHRVLAFPERINLSLSKEFYTSFKEYFLKNLFIEYDAEAYAWYSLLHNKVLSQETILSFIAWLDDVLRQEKIIAW